MGVEKDVPELVTYPPPRPTTGTSIPGAAMSTALPELLAMDSTVGSQRAVAATVITLDSPMPAGA